MCYKSTYAVVGQVGMIIDNVGSLTVTDPLLWKNNSFVTVLLLQIAVPYTMAIHVVKTYGRLTDLNLLVLLSSFHFSVIFIGRN